MINVWAIAEKAECFDVLCSDLFPDLIKFCRRDTRAKSNYRKVLFSCFFRSLGSKFSSREELLPGGVEKLAMVIMPGNEPLKFESSAKIVFGLRLGANSCCHLADC